MLSGTILNLLGYRCKSLNFGMMDWNLAALVKEPWDQEAEYEVEKAENRSSESYPLPIIVSEQSDARGLVKEMAGKYLSGEGSPVILSSAVKDIVDDWARQKDEYQIVDVRSEREYLAGHIPHSRNIPWADIADSDILRKLDVGRTIIVYSENGQTGQLAATILNLLGYQAVDMKFGLMDWNRSYVDRAKRWDGESGYAVEYGN
jgi:rhodanese-related sulfurtransferase